MRARDQILDAEFRQRQRSRRPTRTIIKDFEAANPGVTIKLENRGTDEHKSALRVAAGSDQAPGHLLHVGGPRLGRRVRQVRPRAADGQILRRIQVGRRIHSARAGRSPNNIRAGDSASPPPSAARRSITTRRCSRRPASPASPTTYDELVADADKLAAAQIPAITFGGTVNWHVMRLMDEILEVKCGPEKHDALMAMKVSWADEPCATKAFEELHRWTSKYVLKPFMGIDNAQSFNLFLAGRAAMMLEGNWLVGQLKNANRTRRLRGVSRSRAPRASMASPNTTTSAPRARTPISRQSFWIISNRRRCSRPISPPSARLGQQERQVRQHGAARSRLGENLRPVHTRSSSTAIRRFRWT